MKTLILRSALLLLFSLFLIFFFKKINLIDLSSIKKSYENNLDYLLLAGFSYLFSLMLSIFRLNELFKKINTDISLFKIINATISSIFLGQWLPASTIVVESIKIGILAGTNKKINWKLIASVGLWDRMFGLCNFFALSFAAFIISFYELDIFVILIALLITIFFLFIPIFFIKTLKMIFYSDLLLSRAVSYNKVFLFGFSSALFLSISYYLVSLSLNSNISLTNIIILMPLIVLISLIPLNFGNIGTNQLGALFLFTLFNYNSSEIISISILFGILLLICNSFLGLFFLKNTFKEFKKYFKKNEK